jgi:hypothetical protein
VFRFCTSPLAKSMAAARREMVFAGLRIAVEREAGEVRAWSSPTGERGQTVMQVPHGFIRGADGADGEDLDVYVGPNEAAPFVFLVHQKRAPDFSVFDEDKAMVGFDTPTMARECYLAHYDSRFFGGMSMVRTEHFARLFAPKMKPRDLIKSLIPKDTEGDKAVKRAQRAGGLPNASRMPQQKSGTWCGVCQHYHRVGSQCDGPNRKAVGT